MRIACLQFSPQLGKVQQNIDKADSLLEAVSSGQTDIVVLPELAFSGSEPAFLPL